MAKGYYLVLGDKTTCGGKILGGDPTHTLFGKAIAREQEPVTCGQHPGIYMITGHIPGDSVMGRKFAGTLHSKSSCPCQARFTPSIVIHAYEFIPSPVMSEPKEVVPEVQSKTIQFKLIILDYENEKPVENVNFDINGTWLLDSNEKGETSIQKTIGICDLKIIANEDRN